MLTHAGIWNCYLLGKYLYSHDSKYLVMVAPVQELCLDEKLSRCKAQKNLKPEQPIGCEDFRFFCNAAGGWFFAQTLKKLWLLFLPWCKTCIHQFFWRNPAWSPHELSGDWDWSAFYLDYEHGWHCCRPLAFSHKLHILLTYLYTPNKIALSKLKPGINITY